MKNGHSGFFNLLLLTGLQMADLQLLTDLEGSYVYSSRGYIRAGVIYVHGFLQLYIIKQLYGIVSYTSGQNFSFKYLHRNQNPTSDKRLTKTAFLSQAILGIDRQAIPPSAPPCSVSSAVHFLGVRWKVEPYTLLRICRYGTASAEKREAEHHCLRGGSDLGSRVQRVSRGRSVLHAQVQTDGRSGVGMEDCLCGKWDEIHGHSSPSRHTIRVRRPTPKLSWTRFPRSYCDHKDKRSADKLILISTILQRNIVMKHELHGFSIIIP